MAADYNLTLDATRDSALLTTGGLIQRLGSVLEELQGRPSDLPRRVNLEAIFPDAADAEAVEQKLDKLNKVIEPHGFMDKIAHTAFRTMSGVQGDLAPILYERDSSDPRRTLMSLDISRLSPQDLENFARFLSKNAHKVS